MVKDKGGTMNEIKYATVIMNMQKFRNWDRSITVIVKIPVGTNYRRSCASVHLVGI